MGGILPAALSFCLPPGGRLPLSRGDGRRPKGIGIGGPKGRMRGQGSDCVRCARDISPPAGGVLLFPWRKRRQNATGDAADGLRLRFAPPRSIGPLSPDPILRGLPLEAGRTVPARKIRSACVRSRPAPTGGLSGKKIGVSAVMFLRLPLPNQRPGAGFHRRGAQCAPAGRSGTGPCEGNGTVPVSV